MSLSDQSYLLLPGRTQRRNRRFDLNTAVTILIKLPLNIITMRYRQRKKAELVTFAANRGLQVTSEFPKGPYHREYAAALEQADRDATFRFLDLPAGKETSLQLKHRP